MRSPDGVAQVAAVVLARPCAWSCYRRDRRMALRVVRCCPAVACCRLRCCWKCSGNAATHWLHSGQATSDIQAPRRSVARRANLPRASVSGLNHHPLRLRARLAFGFPWVSSEASHCIAICRRFSTETPCARRPGPGEARWAMAKAHLFVAGSTKGTVYGALRLILTAQSRRHLTVSVHRLSHNRKLSTIRSGNDAPDPSPASWAGPARQV
ncbi:protein of unknown function [Cupriavidus taiwanensis]|nr:protein of unknown function [Cupriavidus taiwanensis]